MVFRKRIPVTFFVCIGLLLAALVFLPDFITFYNKVPEILTGKIEEELSRIWAARVEIEEVKLFFPALELLGVKVHTLDDRPVLTAERVRVQVDWFAFLFQQPVEESLRRLELIEPVLWLDTTETGGLRFPDIINMNDGQNERARANNANNAAGFPKIVIDISGGALNIRRWGEEWPWGDFTGICGRIDLRKFPRITGAVRFSSPLDLKARGRLVLEYEQDHACYEISSVNASAVLWGNIVNSRLQLFPSLRLLGGETDFTLRYVWSRKTGTALDHAWVKLAGAEMKWHELSLPVEQVAAEFVIRPEEIKVHEFHGQYGEGRLALSGRVRPGEQPFLDLRIAAEKLDLAEWTSLFPVLHEWKMAGGAGFKLRLQGALPRPELQGEVYLSRAGLLVPGQGWRFGDLNLSARLSGDKLHFSYMEGTFNGTPFHLQGSVLWQEEPRLDLTVTFNGLAPSEYLPAEWPLDTGEAAGRIQVGGTWHEPVIRGKISCAAVCYEDWRAENLRLTGEYTGNQLVIDSLTFDILDGKAWLAGSVVDLAKEPLLNVKISGRGLDLARLPTGQLFSRVSHTGVRAEIPPLGGCGELQAVLHGSLFRLQGEGWLVVEDGTVDCLEFAGLKGRFSWDGARLHSGLTLQEAAGGRLTVTGWWEPWTGNYHGALTFSRLDLHPEWFGPEFSGFRGKLSGALGVEKNGASPAGMGWVELYDLRHKDSPRPLGHLKLRGKIESEQVWIEDSYFLLNSGRLAIDGRVSRKEGLFYMLKAQGSDILLADLAAFLPAGERLPVPEGLADLEIVATGGARPSIAGHLTVDEFFFQDYFISRGEAHFRWEEGVLYLKDTGLQKEKEKISINGTIKGETLDLQVTAEQLALVTLEIPVYGKHLEGCLDLDGEIKGTFTAPAFTGRLEINRLDMAGLFLDQVAGKVKWQEKVLSVEEMRVVQKDQELKAYGRIDFQDNPGLDLGLRMENTDINNLLLLLGISPAVPVEGKVTGYFRALGTLEQPAVRVMAQVEEGRLNKEYPIIGEVDLQIQNSTVMINRLRIEDPHGECTAFGAYIPGKQFQARIDMKNFALAPLAALAGYRELSAGRVDLQLEVNAAGRGAGGSFSSRLQEVTWDGIPLPEFVFSGEMEESVLYLKGEETRNSTFSVHGKIPLDYNWFEGIVLPPATRAPTEEVDLKFTAKTGEAAFINLFLPRQPVKSGTLDGVVALKGKGNEIHLEGTLKADGITAAIPGLPEEFRGVEAGLEFSRGGLRLKKLEGRYGQGRFQAGGGIFMRGIAPAEFQLEISGERLYYSSPMFDGQFGGVFSLTGPVEKPLLQGEALINKARVSLASITGAPPDWELRLDLNLQAGKDVYFRQYGLASIPLTGRLHVGGTLPKPEINGELTAGRGWINVYGDTFRISRARAEFRPEYELLPYLELEAALFLRGTEITLATQGWTGDDLVFNLSSNPVRTKEEIFSLLNWSERMQDSDNLSLASLLKGNIVVVTDTILGPLFDQFRDLIQVDFLSLEQDRSLGGLRMSIGKALGSDVYLSYSRNLSALAEETWTLEGRLSLNLSLLGEYSSDQGWEWQVFYNIWF